MLQSFRQWIENKRINQPVRQIFDRYISWQYSVENPMIPKIVERIRRQFAYVAMRLPKLVLHPLRLFHPK